MIFKGRKLKPAWTFRTDKKVWRLLPGMGVLTAELRDTDAKISEYAGIDISSGAPLWQGLRLEESWWVIMNRVFRDVLLLQQFVKPDMPTPGKIIVIDLFTGRILWQNSELSFLNVSGDSIYALRRSIRSEEIVALDYRTGTEKISFPADDPRADNLLFPPQQDEFVLPGFLEELADDLPAGRAALLRNAPPADAENPTFIPSVSGKDIIGFYSNAGTDEKGAPVFDSHLMIIDSEGNSIFQDTADRKVYTTLGDFYFVARSKLIYTRNSNEIVAVGLDI